MIDLHLQESHMLSDINASCTTLEGCIKASACSGGDPSREIGILLRGKMSADLMPTLEVTLSERFSEINPKQLWEDLLAPVKRAIGNAYKRGNRKDPTKYVAVCAVVTRTGAVLSISDEGEGFDVDGVLDRVGRDQQYFSNHGSGFQEYVKTRSLISYTRGGRTLLIRYLCSPDPGRAIVESDNVVFGRAGQPAFMKSFFTKRIRAFGSRATLESCRIYVPVEQPSEQPEIRYVLLYRRKGSERTASVTLAGRVLPKSVAQTEFSVAQEFYRLKRNGPDRINIPRPVAVLSSPPLIIYKLNPLMHFRDYFKGVSSFEQAAPVLEMMGRGLRHFHDSGPVRAQEEEMDDALGRHKAAQEKVIASLESDFPQRAERVRRFFSRFLIRAEHLTPAKKVPIHGDLGWTHILSDGKRFFFDRFDSCRMSHAGLDVGGFLADLLRFCKISREDKDLYESCREAFLNSYFADRRPAWHPDLQFFMGGSMLLRLQRLLDRPKKKWDNDKIDALLDECEEALDYRTH